MKKCKNTLGFTLIELMITVSIIALLLSVVAPNFSTLIVSSNSNSAETRLAASLSYGRSEAVTRGVDVTVCASTDFATCNFMLRIIFLK